MCQRLFFKRIAHNREYIQTHCNDCRNPFPFACRTWYFNDNHSYTYTNTVFRKYRIAFFKSFCRTISYYLT